MDNISIKEIIDATHGELIAGPSEGFITGVSADSRELKRGDLFIPIIGERTDGHKYIPQVAEKGAAAVFTMKKEAAEGVSGPSVILVEDSVQASQDLAAYYLDRIQVKRIGITGSVGKTSTRDMTAAICSERFKTGRAQKNLNSTIGTPLAIFGLDSSMDVAVLEEGMVARGEIHDISKIVRPDTAVITNIGIQHIEYLKTRENIRRAKMEITDFFGPENTLVINEDCDMLDRTGIHGDYKVITVGKTDRQDFYVDQIEEKGGEGISFCLHHGDDSVEIHLAVNGTHNAINAALACAAASTFGCTLEDAKKGLEKLQDLTGKRLKFEKNGRFTVIDDTYNAAPVSMKSAIDTLMNTEADRHAAILGEMYELGDEAVKGHREVGLYAAEKKVDLLLTAGDLAKNIAEAAEENGLKNVKWFPDKEKLEAALPDLLKDGDAILLKASNSMHLSETADKILEMK
ncbi:UDP-N-acetylmuramoyl-tripeptide--D-alanyl-D-alanine ligase [Eubacterium sp. F2]|uniref:UDP-N-acetylmuramoyl-tripeptide--D-alanyl-D- alanine ligase n=1 Tax=Eubacterium sp. F2 TaxID=3381348 RepID=UPI003908425E